VALKEKEAALKEQEALAKDLLAEGQKLSKRVLELEGSMKKLRATVSVCRSSAGQAASLSLHPTNHWPSASLTRAPLPSTPKPQARQDKEEKDRAEALLAAERAELENQRGARAAAERELAATQKRAEEDLSRARAEKVGLRGNRRRCLQPAGLRAVLSILRPTLAADRVFGPPSLAGREAAPQALSPLPYQSFAHRWRQRRARGRRSSRAP
jgi:hypothetical protein